MGAMCVVAEIRLFSVRARALYTNNGRTHISVLSLDAVGFVCQFECSEKGDDGISTTAIEKVHFHLRLDFLYHLGNVARHCFVEVIEAFRKEIDTVIIPLAIVRFMVWGTGSACCVA